MKQALRDTLILESISKHVILVTLNRPMVANAFNTDMVIDLYELFENFGMGNSEVRCIVLTGAGKRAFCAGADLKERKSMSTHQWTRQHLKIERMARAMKDCPIPTIGAINGAAFGGGCEIACLQDILYASDSARFALPETGLGIIPGAGGTQSLARAIGTRRAKEVILAGKSFTATQAHTWGLVNQVLPAEQLISASIQTAEKIAANAPIAVQQAKRAIDKGLQMSLSEGLAFEIEAYYRTVSTRDRQEGVLAFNERRKPDFKGC